MEKRAFGRIGERLAEWFLVRRGYQVRDRNARVGRFEIDLVMEREGWLVFVEVKSRGAGSLLGAFESLAPAQRRRLASAAEVYAGRLGGNRSIRFDVVSIDEAPDRLSIEHWPDALGERGELR